MARTNTKERIMDAALELFSGSSYDSVSVDQIAERVGIKGPSLYKHFKNKSDILTTLANIAETYYREKMLSCLPENKYPDSIEELSALSMRMVETTLNDIKIVEFRKFLVREQFRNSRLSSLTTMHCYALIENLFTEIFDRMVKQGLIKPYDAKILAMEYVSPVSLLIHISDREPLKRQEILRRIKEHFEHFYTVYGVK